MSRKRTRAHAGAVTTVAELVRLDDPNHRDHPILRAAGELWVSRSLLDCNVIVDDGREFQAHRLILAAASDYFRALFSSDFADSSSTKHELHEMESPIFDHVLHFIYNGHIQVPCEHLRLVLEAASRLQCIGLVAATATALGQRLTPLTCIQTWRLAEQYTLPDLEATAKAFVLENFTQATSENAFCELPRELLVQLLASDDLNAHESFVLGLSPSS